MKMQLSEIANAIGCDLSMNESAIVSSVVFDSRKAVADSLFVPLVGERDGHDYVANAVANGAVAALWQKDHANRPENIPVLVVDDTLLALQKLAKYYLQKLIQRWLGLQDPMVKLLLRIWWLRFYRKDLMCIKHKPILIMKSAYQ